MTDTISPGTLSGAKGMALNQMGIKIYKASKGTVRDNIGFFENNTRPEITVGQACGGHIGGCGH